MDGGNKGKTKTVQCNYDSHTDTVPYVKYQGKVPSSVAYDEGAILTVHGSDVPSETSRSTIEAGGSLLPSTPGKGAEQDG